MFKSENLNRGDNLEDLNLDERIILKCSLEKWVGGCGLDLSDLG